MQDLTSAAVYYHQSVMMAAKQQPELPEQKQLNCPRCDSPNTKFCYYNNYNLSQPRHFCKNCRRYWTKGGSLRNIPVGGGSRKNSKRSGSSSSSKKPTSESDSRISGTGSKVKEEEERFMGISGEEMDTSRTRMLYGLPIGDPIGDPIGGSFSSMLASNMQMGGINYETGSRWYPGMDLGLGSDYSRSDNVWTDLAMNSGVDNN